MPKGINDLIKARLFRFIFLVLVIGITVMLITPNSLLTEVLNIFAMSFAAAVIVAFAPLTWRAMFVETPASWQVLAAGIFLTQLGTLINRIVSYSARTLNFRELAYSDFLNFGILCFTIGAVCHLNAPEVLDGGVPTKQWLRIAWIVGISVAVVTGFFVWRI